MDCDGLKDRTSTSSNTSYCTSLRAEALQRDVHCVVTLAHRDDCDAAHIIPRSKGPKVVFIIKKCDDPDISFKYIRRVLRNRYKCYDLRDPPELTRDIDDILNGVLLGKSLHSMLGRGAVAFIKVDIYIENYWLGAIIIQPLDSKFRFGTH